LRYRPVSSPPNGAPAPSSVSTSAEALARG
jgi:hypothetical protein